jgi:tetratricopeptide (TPR) repeat protein
VKFTRLVFALLFVLLGLGQSFGETPRVVPIDRTQLVAWITGGVSNARIARLATERRVSFTVSPAEEKKLRAVGVDAGLIRALRAAHRGPDSKMDCPPALYKAAELAHAKKYDAAASQLTKLLQSDSDNSSLHFAFGQMLLLDEQFDGAMDEFSESARLTPGFPETHSRLAYLFYRSDDSANTIAEARTALSMDPGNAEAYRYLGLGLVGTGKTYAALNAYEQSLIREPENPDTYYDIGIARREVGDLRGAMVAYRHALRIKSDFWEAHSNLGVVLHDLGRLDEAVLEYREAKRLAPDESSVRNNLGNTYCDKGEYDAAIAEFRELYRMDAGWDGGHACMAQAFMVKKDYASAIGELRQTVLQNPTGASEHRVLGQALLLAGKPEEALKELEAAVYLGPDSAVAHHYLGTALFETQSFQQAEKEFREAVRLEPSAQNHYSLAACLMAMGHNDEALAELENASRLDPAQNLYRARKEELLKVMGQPTHQ